MAQYGAMKNVRLTLMFAALVSAGFGLALPGCSRQAEQPPPASGAAPDASLNASLPPVVPDLDRRLAQFKPVQMPFDAVGAQRSASGR